MMAGGFPSSTVKFPKLGQRANSIQFDMFGAGAAGFTNTAISGVEFENTTVSKWSKKISPLRSPVNRFSRQLDKKSKFDFKNAFAGLNKT